MSKHRLCQGSLKGIHLSPFGVQRQPTPANTVNTPNAMRDLLAYPAVGVLLSAMEILYKTLDCTSLGWLHQHACKRLKSYTYICIQ
jgi:hypothetical protein